MSPIRYKLAPSDRIERAGEFRAVFNARRRERQGPFMLHWRPAPPEARPRLGIVVSRVAGNAVRRNDAKRMVREQFRRSKERLSPGDYIVRLGVPLGKQARAEFGAAIERLFSAHYRR